MIEVDKQNIAEIAEKHVMTKERLIKRLQELAKDAKEWELDKGGGSPESAHVNADSALLGYIGDKEVTKAFNNIDKWYA